MKRRVNFIISPSWILTHTRWFLPTSHQTDTHHRSFLLSIIVRLLQSTRAALLSEIVCVLFHIPCLQLILVCSASWWTVLVPEGIEWEI